MSIIEWMDGFAWRSVEVAKAPQGIVEGVSKGFDVSVRRNGRIRWQVTISAPVADVADQIQERFLSSVLVTGDRADEIRTDRLREVWAWTAADFGVRVPLKDRGAGVEILRELPGVTRGRGLLRGVAFSPGFTGEPEVEAVEVWDVAKVSEVLGAKVVAS